MSRRRLPLTIGKDLRFANMEGQPEIFHTVQGEGRHMGEPSVFARFSGCNLQCVWCDTPYTWNWTDKDYEHDTGVKYDRAEQTLRIDVGLAVDQITGYNCKRLVVTGGEPLIQQSGVISLIDTLREVDPDYWLEIETNGTIVPKPELVERVNQFNVSPKLLNSNNAKDKRDVPEAMEAFVAIPQADFKFVLQGEDDITEVLALVDKYRIPPHRVDIMPEGRTLEEVETRQRDLVEFAKEHNFNITTRLHVIVWGAKRGV